MRRSSCPSRRKNASETRTFQNKDAALSRLIAFAKALIRSPDPTIPSIYLSIYLRMRLKTSVSIVSGVLLALTMSAPAQQSESSAVPSPTWNDNLLISIQKGGADPTRSGDVKIEFYGHDAFKITSPEGLTVLTDPWRNDSSAFTHHGF